jgi:hypothetical protein
MDHRQEVHGQFLESRAQTTALLEPPHALFDHAAPSVELAVETLPSVLRVLVLPPRDDRLDRVITQPLADRGEAVALVASDSAPDS